MKKNKWFRNFLTLTVVILFIGAGFSLFDSGRGQVNEEFANLSSGKETDVPGSARKILSDPSFQEQPVEQSPDPSESFAKTGADSQQKPSAETGRGAESPTPPDSSDFSRFNSSKRTIADILEGVDLSLPGERERVMAEMAELEESRKQAGIELARERGLPTRLELPDGTVKEIAGVDDEGEPVYFITHNENAAISTGVNLLRTVPYNLQGEGITIGMWDGGSGRSTHQEFGTRMVAKDGAASIDHATHVGGTLAAAGVVATARGMASKAIVDSYDWNNDKSEMTSRAASFPGETGKIYLSNHSYGYVSGWYRTGGSNPAFIWYGSGSTNTAIDPRFGQYNTFSRDSDAIAFSAPYYLMFRSAGNDRTDNPSNGQTVRLSTSSTATTTYDSSIHPAGDGLYRNGYDTIGFDSVAKNVVTIGSVNDAVTNGVRDPTKALMANYSSWGPTDDGRIKPDLVANGQGVYSSRNGSNTSYGTLSGTSMSSPNAAGTAALLVQKYNQLFPGSAMRASTLKGLLIHTADALGNQPGPDYRNGWGLINGQAAADLIRDHAENPLKIRLTEDLLQTGDSPMVHDFVWDGVSPVRVTLSWTDPAGSATTSSDLRSPRLRNNLDLKVLDPLNDTHLPYVMPFVGDWSTQSMALPATTGVNNTDNVEQVFIAAPPAPGTYRAIISFQGTLANNQQHYSLLVSGSVAEIPPPPPLSLSAVSPATGLAGGTVTLDVSGTALETVNSVTLSQDGFPDIPGFNLQPVGQDLRAQFDLANAAPGLWDVVVKSNEESATLVSAFTVIGALWSENFDSDVTGWASSSTQGTNSWTLTTAQSHTPSRSYFVPGPANRTTTHLTSPGIPIPDTATDLQLRFWHHFDLESQRDGGRLEISINGSPWFGVDDSNSGAAFASNGYTAAIRGNAAFNGSNAWTGNSNGFIETIVNLTDNAKFANKTVRFRWTLSTNNSTSSPGWYVDSIALLGGGDFLSQPPQITSNATISTTATVVEDGIEFAVVRGASAEASVTATDNGESDGLTFTWIANGPAPVFFLPNASPGAATTTATFEALGDYEFTVTVTGTNGLSATSSVAARVLAIADGIEISPAAASVVVGTTQAFSATLLDQFNNPIVPQPANFEWSVTGGGTIDSIGLFSAIDAGENFAVNGSVTSPDDESETLASVSLVTVTPAPATIILGNLTQTFDGSPKSVSVVTDPANLSVLITYDGVETVPSAVGEYAVAADSIDPNYQGNANAILTIEAAPTGSEPPGYADWREENFGEGSTDDPAAAPGADPDGDGFSNLAEFYLGTDPNDSNSRLSLRVHAIDLLTGTIELDIGPVVIEGIFILESTTDLVAGWQEELVLEITEAQETFLLTRNRTDPRTFFRIRYHLPLAD